MSKKNKTFFLKLKKLSICSQLVLFILIWNSFWGNSVYHNFEKSVLTKLLNPFLQIALLLDIVPKRSTTDWRWSGVGFTLNVHCFVSYCSCKKMVEFFLRCRDLFNDFTHSVSALLVSIILRFSQTSVQSSHDLISLKL